MPQRHLSHLNGRKLDHSKFMPLIFCMSGFTLHCAANLFILMILCDLSLSPAQLCYIVVYARKFLSPVQIADQCAFWNFSKGAEEFVLQQLQSEN
jgi:hypothetical protein